MFPIVDNHWIRTHDQGMADLNYMRWFTVIVEEGSFTRAASRLGLTKSAVSKGIAELETHLGTRLLQRTTRRVTPTAAGRALYENVSEAIQKLELAELDVSGRSRKAGGLLRVAAPVTFTRAFLHAVIPQFLSTYPDVQLQLIPISGQYDPVQVDADLLIQTGPLADSSAGFAKLGSVPQGIFASKEFRARHGRFERPEELEGLVSAGISGKPGPTVWELTRNKERVWVKVLARLIVPDPVLHLAFASAGLGVVIAPAFLANELTGRGKLVALLPDWSPPEVPLFGLYPERTRPSVNVSLFLEVVRRHLKELRLQG
ncbi:LysR family transcriptional regulator [Terriglobus albidus]|uniref:LysR family transcriptional regulator n=1 Tax=Terriglobus albidus TaxID=1592106 RepID=A0A5B9EFZ3_9BACT|nr:LysR family transcriptional regulator [Terriglobus albidus]QEE30719.1 LysR family transcriptional regulator [Terriglobus albidus]